MKKLQILLLIACTALSGCATSLVSAWRDGAENNCAQESMASRRESCTAWVDQKAWDLDRHWRD
ncbi:MAG: hypothetical protein ABWZ40_02545 [Caulobacterales bacterium]